MRVLLHTLGLALAAASTLLACAADDAASSEGELRDRGGEGVGAAEAEALFSAVDDNCAGNDNGHFGRFDPKTFDAAAIMQKLREDDTDAWGVDCASDHAYSTSRAAGVEMFAKHIADNEWEDTTCLEEHLSKEALARLHGLVSDPTNLGVFASVYDGHGEGNSEACAYYTFHVYRADGVTVALTFNHTD